MLAVLAAAPYRRTTTAEGEILPVSGLSGIIVPRNGYISAIYVKAGQRVAAGTPIAAISSDTGLVSGGDLGSKVENALALKERAYSIGLNAQQNVTVQAQADIAVRQGSLAGQIGLIEAALELARRRLKGYEARLQKARPLLEKGFISGFQMQEYQEAVSMAELAINEQEGKLLTARGDYRQLAVERRKLSASAAVERSNVDAARADVLSAVAETAGRRKVILVAQRTGKITGLIAKVGGVATAGDVLATIVPLGSPYQAQLWVSSKAIAFVNRGDKVKLTFDAYPRETFGTLNGQVAEVAEAPQGGTSDRAKLYPIIVKLASQSIRAQGKEWRFVPSMKVQANLVLEERTFLQYALGSSE